MHQLQAEGQEMLCCFRIPEEASQEAVQLMEQCLHVDPRERPMAKQIVERLQVMVDRSSWDCSHAPVPALRL